MNVSVFGGSQLNEGSQGYADARSLGELLARRGHTVLTGGYTGTMEAVSRGAAEAGAHVIGITCDEIGNWRGLPANRWVAEERKETTLIERLLALIKGCDAALALPGGPGTLAEIALMWNLMIIGAEARRPLILIGDGWGKVWDSLYSALGDFTPAAQREYLQLAKSPLGAVEALDAWRG